MVTLTISMRLPRRMKELDYSVNVNSPHANPQLVQLQIRILLLLYKQVITCGSCVGHMTMTTRYNGTNIFDLLQTKLAKIVHVGRSVFLYLSVMALR